jgi:hypothetical protein
VPLKVLMGWQEFFLGGGGFVGVKATLVMSCGVVSLLCIIMIIAGERPLGYGSLGLAVEPLTGL